MLKNSTFSGIECNNSGTNLDTLAQLPTKNTDVTLKKRARSKHYTQLIAGKLAQLDDTKLKQYYDNAWHCCGILLQEGQTLKGKYCNTRICHVCNRIRTAKMMNSYLPQFENLNGLQFTTLTAPTIDAKNLQAESIRRRAELTKIIRVFRERRGYDMSGIIKQETTYNFENNLYHPHLHIINDNNLGDEIIYEWLKRFPEANRKAQYISNVTQGAFNELFKYTTKISHKLSKNKNEFDIFLPAINTIMESQYKRRTIQTFGNINRVSEDVEKLQSSVYNIPEYDAVIWVYNDHDWYSEHGALTGYKPSEKLKINFYD